MNKITNVKLRPNPFTTYRDPETGIWKVLKANLESSESGNHSLKLECSSKQKTAS